MNNYGDATTGPIFYIIELVVIVLFLVSCWKVFAKAGKPGWAAIVPIYNVYIMLKIASKPGWWLILYFIPLVNVVVSLIVSVGVARAFGKSTVFGIFGLWLFSFIGYPILAFGSSQYLGVGESGQSQPPLNSEQTSLQSPQQVPQQQPASQQVPQQGASQSPQQPVSQPQISQQQAAQETPQQSPPPTITT